MGIDNIYVVSEWISFTIAFISFCCTLTTLLLIRQMKKWNGYLMLISTMTFFQLLYDINYMLGPVPSYDTCVLWNFLDVLGGLGNSFTSNIISLTVIYVVYRVKSFNILANYKLIYFFCGIIPLIVSILTFAVVRPQREDDDIPFQFCVYTTSPLAYAVSGIYYWGRVFEIIFNCFAFIYISFKVKKMASLATTNTATLADNNVETNTQFNTHRWVTEQQLEAVFTLASRLKYYPLVQALCRAGSAWNEFLDYKYSNHASIITAAICAPLSGACYFVVFLIMQPHARSILYNFLMGKSATSTINMEKHHRNTSKQENNEDLSKRFVFRDSLNFVDESELEEIINDPAHFSRIGAAELVSLPMHWTSNPVRDSENMNMRTTGSMMYSVEEEGRTMSTI